MTNLLILLRDKCRNMSPPQTKNESNENFTYFSFNIAKTSDQQPEDCVEWGGRQNWCAAVQGKLRLHSYVVPIKP